MCSRMDFSFEGKKKKKQRRNKALVHVQIDSVTVNPQDSWLQTNWEQEPGEERLSCRTWHINPAG